MKAGRKRGREESGEGGKRRHLHKCLPVLGLSWLQPPSCSLILHSGLKADVIPDLAVEETEVQGHTTGRQQCWDESCSYDSKAERRSGGFHWISG